jgi:hypothetical protein
MVKTGCMTARSTRPAPSAPGGSAVPRVVVGVDHEPDENEECPGWEIVCPDGLIRDYPYHNREDAEDMAEVMTTKRCNGLWPKPGRLELEQPPCPEGKHVVRAIKFECPDPARAN